MAEDCPDGDYLGAYSRFFSEFVAKLNPYNQLPVSSASSYKTTETEIVGEIITVTLHYLKQMQCPSSLEAHLVHQVIQEIKAMCKKRPEDCGYRPQEKMYISLKLLKAIIGKVNEICTRYLDNSRLALLPPPRSPPLPQVSVGGSKNCRRKMEDRYTVLQDLHTIFGIEDDSVANYYAVFDGHGGQDAAVYCACHLHQYLVESIYYPTDPERALRDAFLTTDAQFIDKSQSQERKKDMPIRLCGGTTAVCTLILNKRLYVAWVGDSTAILIKRDITIELVNPHRLHREDEVQRIQKAGGVVTESAGIKRVNGVLCVSRAIGDVRYKQFITGEPETRSIRLDGTEDMLVLATDGLTDYLDIRQILTILYQEIERDPNGIARVHEILLQSAKRAGSQDNITVIVVLLTPASVIAARRPSPCHLILSYDTYEKMNSKDKPLFLDIDDAHNAINSNILKQTIISQEPRDHDDDGILAASNGKHENGDADYDYSDLGPETDVDAIDDVTTTMPTKNLSFEFYKDLESARNEGQPDKDSNVLDNMDVDESTNANFNVNINATREPIADNSLHEDDDDDDDDDEDDNDANNDDNDDNDNNDNNVRVHVHVHVREDNQVPDEITVSKTVQDEIPEKIHEIIREGTNNEGREQLKESLGDEKTTQTKNEDQADDAQDVVDKAGPVDYDDSPPSPQANKPLQHALIHEPDNVADSEDSEDEWNYYRVDPNKEKDSATPVDEPRETKNVEDTEIIPDDNVPLVKDTESKIQSEGIEEDIKCESPKEESLELINTEISAEERTKELIKMENLCAEEEERPKDMDFQLNPNAAEFIPVSPQFMGTRMNLAKDYPVSGSPFKQLSEMDDIQVPSQSEFEKEVCKRPREVETEEKEYQNGDSLQRTEYADFMSDRQKATGMSGNMDDSEISSTKAEFGDESTASFLTTSEFHRTGISAVDESFENSERDYDISKDPMAMSFTPSDFEAAFDKGVDLNAVHNLSNTDLEDKNGSIDKEELTTESTDLQADSVNLIATSDSEEPVGKSVFPEEPAEFVNLSSQQKSSEDTFIEHASESKTDNVDFLNLRSESSQMEQQEEPARYDRSPLTENYPAEFETEKEPVSVDNEQPLSPSSGEEIDDTKPIDEASEDAALPGSDFQKEETCPNEADDTPSSLSPVPDAMENDLVASVKDAEIPSSILMQSSLHPDAPEFLPGHYNFQSYGMESGEISQSPAKTSEPCQASSTKAADSYSAETDNTFEIKQDLVANIQLDEKEVDELVCTKPSVQENLLDFTEERDVSMKSPQIQCELTPPLSPQEVKENVIDNVIRSIESSVTSEQKSEIIESKEIPEETTVIKDKAEEIAATIEESIESAILDIAEPMESVKEPTLNLSDSMQEFTGLESQLQPKEKEILEFGVVENVQEKLVKQEELKDVKESEKLFEFACEKEYAIQEKKENQEFPVEMKESEVKELDIEKLEIKEREIANVRVESLEVEQLKVEEPEIKEFESNEPELKGLEIKESKLEELKMKEPEIKEPEIKESEIKESEIKEPEIKEPEIKEPELKESEIKEPELKEPELKELELKEPEVEELKIKEPEVKEPETKELAIKDLEAKVSEVMKESEIKEPEVKESEINEPEAMKETEIKEPETTKESETKEVEIKEPEVEKANEVSENKITGTAAAAVAATATAVAAGAVAVQSKTKTKTSATKPAKTTTSKTATPKSTPTSPSKTAVSTTRTLTATTKKPTATAPSRPKDLDAPKKSTTSSTTAVSKSSIQKSASKTTTSTAATKPTTRASLTSVSKSKPAATAPSKPAATDKKPTANGDVKPLSKPSSTKPSSKAAASPATKTTLVKTSTGRMSIGTTTTKPRPASVGTTSKSSTIPKSSSTPITTTTASTITTASSRPKTAPTVGTATKTRTLSAVKSTIIDKQVKETANKQISMGRTSTASSKTTRVSTNSSTTTVKRVSSTTKTTTAASPTKKSTAVSKVSKTSLSGKTTVDKGKVLQNGVSENVEINTIIDDVPKKDLSPVVAPNDNQLIMSSD